MMITVDEAKLTTQNPKGTREERRGRKKTLRRIGRIGGTNEHRFDCLERQKQKQKEKRRRK